jgi:hypothetical protein
MAVDAVAQSSAETASSAVLFEQEVPLRVRMDGRAEERRSTVLVLVTMRTVSAPVHRRVR